MIKKKYLIYDINCQEIITGTNDTCIFACVLHYFVCRLYIVK